MSGKARVLDVLVVEDNPVNQKVVRALLTKWGHRVVLACDGAVGLEALGRQAFDLVLMDIQMPAMDGIQATRAIRAKERECGGHIPIIAITAHAGIEDRVRCLDAGVDQYLTKPINSELLRQAISTLIPVAGCDSTRPGVGVATGPVDFDLMKEFVGDDPELLAEVIDIFLADTPLALESAGDAITKADAGAVEMSAHRLKGSLSTMGAAAAAETAQLLESLAHGGGLDGAAELFARLRVEVAVAGDSLRQWRELRAA